MTREHDTRAEYRSGWDRVLADARKVDRLARYFPDSLTKRQLEAMAFSVDAGVVILDHAKGEIIAPDIGKRAKLNRITQKTFEILYASEGVVTLDDYRAQRRLAGSDKAVEMYESYKSYVHYLRIGLRSISPGLERLILTVKKVGFRFDHEAAGVNLSKPFDGNTDLEEVDDLPGGTKDSNRLLIGKLDGREVELEVDSREVYCDGRYGGVGLSDNEFGVVLALYCAPAGVCVTDVDLGRRLTFMKGFTYNTYNRSAIRSSVFSTRTKLAMVDNKLGDCIVNRPKMGYMWSVDWLGHE